jgi:hypothetical protein
MRTTREVPNLIQTEFKEVMKDLWGSHVMCPFHSFLCMINAAFFWEGGKFSIESVVEYWWCYAFEDTAPYPDEGMSVSKVVPIIQLKLFFDACEKEGHGLSDQFRIIVDDALTGEYGMEVPELVPVMHVLKSNHNQTVHLDKEIIMGKVTRVQAAKVETEVEKPTNADKAGDMACELLYERKFTDQEIANKIASKLGEDVGIVKAVRAARKWMNAKGEEWFKGVTKNPVEEIEAEGGTPPPSPKQSAPARQSRSTPPPSTPTRMARAPRAVHA